jgi:hypothetical protein
VRTRVLIRLRSPLLMLPNVDMIMSWASFAGSIGPADLGHPQRHVPVFEQRKRVAELVAVERPLRLAHHYCVERAAGVGQLHEQQARLGPPRGRDGARLVHVEVLGHDHATARRDELVGA